MARELTPETKEIIEELKVFLPKLITASESVSDLFYEIMSPHSWDIFGQFVGGIENLTMMLKIIEDHLLETSVDYAIHPFIVEFSTDLSEKFHLLNRNVVAEELISVGDLIKYELLPLFNSLALKLGEENEIRQQRFITNLNFLKDNYPVVYDHIKELDRNEADYQLISAYDGSDNLYVMNTENIQSYIYSQYNPDYEAARWAEINANSSNGTKCMMMYGLGLGYHLYHMGRLNQNVEIYLLEPDEQVLLAAMHTIELESLFNIAQVKMFTVRACQDEVEKMASILTHKSDGNVQVNSIPIYNQLYKEHKKLMIEQIELIVDNHIVNKRTMKVKGHQHAKNILFNVAANLSTPSLENFKNSLPGMSAVIVGAGPSLELDIEYLKSIKSHAIIIAAGTAIQSLQHFGITPHLVVSMDGLEANYNAFKNIDRKEISLIYIPQIEHKIVDAQFSNTMHAYFANDELSYYIMGLTEEDPLFNSNYSVTGTAIQIAAYLGCNEVIFTGQDFSYPTDSMYAAGAMHVGEEQNDRTIAGATQWTENIHGSMNRTNLSMKFTLMNIEKEIRRFPDVKFTNTSQLGAKIKNTKWESMNETLKRLVSENQSNHTIEKVLQGQVELYSLERRAKIIARLYEMPKQIEDMEIKLTQIKKRLSKLIDLGRIHPDKCLKSMATIEDEWGEVVINKTFMSLYQYVLKATIFDFDRNLPDLAAEKNIQKKAEFFVEVIGELVEAMQTCTPELKQYVIEAIHRVKQLELEKNIIEVMN